MILVLSPHTDDSDLAAGATISKFIDQGEDVMVIAFSDCDNPSCGMEFYDAQKILGVTQCKVLDFKRRVFTENRQRILDHLLTYTPSLVLCPSSADCHQDHQVIHEEAIRAFKKSKILGYNLPWNNTKPVNFNCTHQVSRIDAAHKVEALACYESQAHRKYMSEDYVYWSLKSNPDYEYSESFEVIRWKL
jgi:N-acetylglucosamine malate deacetylase 1